jgi:hypothetical protein
MLSGKTSDVENLLLGKMSTSFFSSIISKKTLNRKTKLFLWLSFKKIVYQKYFRLGQTSVFLKNKKRQFVFDGNKKQLYLAFLKVKKGISERTFAMLIKLSVTLPQKSFKTLYTTQEKAYNR